MTQFGIKMADFGSDEDSNVDVEAVIEVVEAPHEGLVTPPSAIEPYDVELLPTTVPPPVRLRGIGATTVLVRVPSCVTCMTLHRVLYCFTFCSTGLV